MAIRGVHHVAISVPDLEKARAFYVDILGCTECARTEWKRAEVPDRILDLKGTAAKLMMLRAGDNFFLELFEFSAPDPGPLDTNRPVVKYGYTHFCFEVSDIAAVHKRLAAAGMRFHCDPQASPNSTATYGRDPFGNVIELIEIPPGSDFPRLQ